MLKKSLIFVISKRDTIKKVIVKKNDFFIGKRLLFMSEGSASSTYLKMLNLDKISKEMAIIAVDNNNEEKTLEFLDNKLNLSEKNTGIAFSVPMKSAGVTNSDIRYENFPYHLINVITEKGKSKDVIDSIRKLNIRGGTIIEARGAGIPKNFYFPINIEPQKEIVLILIKNNEVEKLLNFLTKDLNLDKPNSSVLFILPVNYAVGIPGVKKVE